MATRLRYLSLLSVVIVIIYSLSLSLPVYQLVATEHTNEIVQFVDNTSPITVTPPIPTLLLPFPWRWNYTIEQLQSIYDSSRQGAYMQYDRLMNINWELISTLSYFTATNVSKLLLDLSEHDILNALIWYKFLPRSPVQLSRCGAQYHQQMLFHDDGHSVTSYLRQVE